MAGWTRVHRRIIVLITAIVLPIPALLWASYLAVHHNQLPGPVHLRTAADLVAPLTNPRITQRSTSAESARTGSVSAGSTAAALRLSMDPELHGALVRDHKPVVITDDTKERVAEVSADTSYGIPEAAFRAYHDAAAAMATRDPSCHLTWGVLAAIGQVESNHGRYAGSQVLADGEVYPVIVGMPLDGAGARARIADTDNGVWDHDTVWDRAVGPMQFIPSTWRSSGLDGDGDGVADPNDFDDAALSAAAYLCAGSANFATAANARAAVFSYNHSSAYVSLVLRLARGYDEGAAVVLPNGTADGAAPAGATTESATPTPSPEPTESAPTTPTTPVTTTRTTTTPPKTPSPSPTRSTSPPKDKQQKQSPPSSEPPASKTPRTTTPTSEPPTTKKASKDQKLTGTLSFADGVWSIDGEQLDFETPSLALQAGNDYDGNGITGSLQGELEGLSASDTVTVRVDRATGNVTGINGRAYAPPALDGPVSIIGTVSGQGNEWMLADVRLPFDTTQDYSAVQATDLDGDGADESLEQELQGMADADEPVKVTLSAWEDGVVTTVNDVAVDLLPYCVAGSPAPGTTEPTPSDTPTSGATTPEPPTATPTPTESTTPPASASPTPTATPTPTSSASPEPTTTEPATCAMPSASSDDQP